MYRPLSSENMQRTIIGTRAKMITYTRCRSEFRLRMSAGRGPMRRVCAIMEVDEVVYVGSKGSSILVEPNNLQPVESLISKQILLFETCI